MKKKVFCIIGESGSGKSTILNMIMKYSEDNNLGYKKLIYSTTRKKRDNEVDGVDYHFVDKNTGIDKIKKEAIEYRVYSTIDNGTSVYFTNKEDFGDINDTTPLICTPSPDQAVQFIKYCRTIGAEIYIMKIGTNTKDRVIHLMARCKDDLQAKEALRRMEDEKSDFSRNFITMVNSSDKFVTINNNYDNDISDFIKFIQDNING